VRGVREKNRPKSNSQAAIAEQISGAIPRSTGQRDAIGQKVIGRTLPVGPLGRGCKCVVRGEDGTLALLDEPAREEGRGVLLHPCVKELGDFLSQIGSMGKPGKLVALQGVARGREKELPGSLGPGLRHSILQGYMGLRYQGDISTLVILRASNGGVNSLWKTVEKQEKSVGVCSGCAGDYEDPDWTAWEGEEEGEEQGEHE